MKANDCPYCDGSGVDPSFSGAAKFPCKVCFPEYWQQHDLLITALDEAERKAIDNLSRYKFQNFGYWAAWWVKLNRLSGLNRPNPFRPLVNQARIVRVGIEDA
jgi:hypothetical protein